MKLLTKLFLFFVPLTLLLIGSAAIISRSGMRRILVSEVNNHGLAQIADNTQALSRAFESKTEAALLPLLQSLKEQTQGAQVAVLDQTGRVMAHTNVMEKNKIYSDALTTRMLRSNLPVSQEIAVKGEKILALSSPVWREEEEEQEDFMLSAGDKPKKQRLGTIILQMPLTRTIQLENRLFMRQMALLILAVGGLSLGLIFFAIFVILRPARRLAAGISKVSEGRYGLVVPVVSKDELGQLTAVFNRMAKNLSDTTVSRDTLVEEVAERKRVEAALRETEEKFRMQFEGAMDAIFLADAKTGLLMDLNTEAAKLVGRKKSELIGWHQRILHPPALPGKESSEDSFKRHLTGKSGMLLETQVITKTGEIKEVAIMSNLLEIRGRKVLQGIFRDVTERKKAEIELQKREELYRTTFETTGMSTVLLEEDAVISLANAEFERLSGYSKPEIEGRKKWTEFVVKEDLERMLAQHRLRREHPADALTQYEFHFITRFGDIRNILLFIAMIPSTKRSIASLMDITERRKADDALRKSEKRFQQVADNSNTWIWEIDAAGMYTYSNSVVENMLGFKPEEIVGCKYVYDFFAPDVKETLKNDVLEGFRGKKRIIGFINPSIHKNGSTVILETTGEPILDKEGELLGYRGADIDISERKRLESSLLQSEKMSAVGQLAAGVAHEINNPLGIILGFAQSVVKRIKNEDDPLALPLKTIEREAVRCRNLVQNLLVFSRASNSAQSDGVDLNAAAESALSLILAQTKTHNVELVQELASGLPRIRVNITQFQQILINLANNSIDAMPQGGTLTIGTSLPRKRPGYVELRVRDTGAGIPKELQKKIFEPFFTTKEVGKGTGLGLSLVYEIVQKHGGTIELESKEGKGTEFTVCLPVNSECGV